MINFLHIPKCGGSTVRHYILKAVSCESSRSDNRKTIFAYGTGCRMGDLNISGASLSEMSERGYHPSQIKAIVGHYNYNSLTTFLGHTNTYSTTFSLVRSPVLRIISNINYIKSNSSHRAYSSFLGITRENAYEYLCSNGKNGRASTYQLRLLTSLSHEDIVSNVDEAVKIASSRVRIYKVENSRYALNACVSYFPPERELEIRNETTTKPRPNNPYFKELSEAISVEQFSRKQIEYLNQLYYPDFALWESSI